MNKISRALFHIFSREAIWPKEFSKSMQGFKSAILAIFHRRPGWPFPISIGPSKSPQRISKKF
jgi:hypothetical protein